MRNLLLLPLLLGACSAEGPLFDETKVIKGNGATLIVYRPPQYSAATADWVVHLDQKSCPLKYGSYWEVHELKGIQHITADHWGSPGTSRIALDVQSSGIHYLKIEIDGTKTAAAILGGMAGYLVAEGISSTGGPFIFIPVDSNQAKKDLQGLKQDCGIM